MTLDERIKQLIGPLVQNRVYTAFTPDNPTLPLVVYQTVGGHASFYLEGGRPDHKHSRIQFSVWSRDRGDVVRISDGIELAISESGLIAEPYGAAVDDAQDELKLYGSRQDFGIWYPRQ